MTSALGRDSEGQLYDDFKAVGGNYSVENKEKPYFCYA